MSGGSAACPGHAGANNRTQRNSSAQMNLVISAAISRGCSNNICSRILQGNSMQLANSSLNGDLFPLVFFVSLW